MGDEALQIRLLGPLTVQRGGVALTLPASRKVRALFAYLATAPAQVLRGRLCELLWEVPNDPRGELRWSLSKLRGVLDEEGHARVEANGDSVRLELSGCDVDVARVAGLATPQSLTTTQLRELCELFRGPFGEGLELERNPQFGHWLGGQRRRFHAAHVSLLRELSRRMQDSDESFAWLEKWLALAPFDIEAHECMLAALLRGRRIDEGEEHLAATIRLFESEGLEWLPLRETWRALRRTPSANDATAVVPSAPVEANPVQRSRAAICIMPFADRTEHRVRGGLADGLTEDVITRLAKLRVLFVIARGSAYALAEKKVAPEEAGRLLNVDYVVTGTLRSQGARVSVSIELVEARNARIVWTDEISHSLDDAVLLSGAIADRVVAAVAEEVEAAERKRSILMPMSSLDAWSAYHRGLWHMYRFNRDDNEQAANFFQMAIHRDPTFARAHAGLSFVHFQNAFLGHTAERQRAIDAAFASAGESLVADDRDPAAHWAMGRALWLRGSLDAARVELEQSVSLSPNFALGHYTLGFVNSQAGDPQSAIASADYSRQLSPFDPLQFAMLASRGLAHFRLGQYEEAAAWAVKGASRPNSHVHVLAIAANCLAAAERVDEALPYVDAVRRNSPGYRIDDFLAAFRFAPDATAAFRRHAQRIGL